MGPLKFGVYITDPSHVRVTWSEELSRSAAAELHDILFYLHGVELVTCRKYSATVEVAGHVRRVGRVAADIRDLLQYDPEFLALFENRVVEVFVGYSTLPMDDYDE